MTEREIRDALATARKPEPPAFFAARVTSAARRSRGSRAMVAYAVAAGSASCYILGVYSLAVVPVALAAVLFPELPRAVLRGLRPWLR